MPCIATGLDQLNWDKVKLLIKETVQTSTVHVVVYILPHPEIKHEVIPVENEPTSKFAQAQEADEALKHVRRWVRQKFFLHKMTFKSFLAWHGRCRTNWVVYLSKMVFFFR